MKGGSRKNRNCDLLCGALERDGASMKGGSRKNRNWLNSHGNSKKRLNEGRFPKEPQSHRVCAGKTLLKASMKGGSRKNRNL